MSWGSEADRPISEFLAMPVEDRKRLSWPEASKFVSMDTLSLSQWMALYESGKTPCDALSVIHNLQPSDFKTVSLSGSGSFASKDDHDG